MTALRYLLGAVAGCAAPLWCRVRGHQLYTTQWADYPWRLEYCGRCGDEWYEQVRRRAVPPPCGTGQGEWPGVWIGEEGE